MCTSLDAPVQAPLQHSQGLVQRKGAERYFIIETKKDVGPDPPPKARRLLHADVKIGKLRILYNCEIRIQQVDRAAQKFDGSLEMRLEGADG